MALGLISRDPHAHSMPGIPFHSHTPKWEYWENTLSSEPINSNTQGSWNSCGIPTVIVLQLHRNLKYNQSPPASISSFSCAESMVHYYNHALSSKVPELLFPSDLLSHPPVAILTSREPSKPLPLCLHETTEVTFGRQSHWVVSPHTYSQNLQPGSWHCPGIFLRFSNWSALPGAHHFIHLLLP